MNYPIVSFNGKLSELEGGFSGAIRHVPGPPPRWEGAFTMPCRADFEVHCGSCYHLELDDGFCIPVRIAFISVVARVAIFVSEGVPRFGSGADPPPTSE